MISFSYLCRCLDVVIVVRGLAAQLHIQSLPTPCISCLVEIDDCLACGIVTIRKVERRIPQLESSSRGTWSISEEFFERNDVRIFATAGGYWWCNVGSRCGFRLTMADISRIVGRSRKTGPGTSHWPSPNRTSRKPTSPNLAGSYGQRGIGLRPAGYRVFLNTLIPVDK